MSVIPLFTFYRTDEVIKSGNEIIGNRGILTVSGKQYFTVERNIITHVNIPEGLFSLKMELSPTKKVNGQTRKQFRINGHNVIREGGGLANLLLHRGASPGTLTGCIAPGKDKTNTGITQSDEAIEELFSACDGFVNGKNAATLHVISGPRPPIISEILPDFKKFFGGANSNQSTSESPSSSMSSLSELLNY